MVSFYVASVSGLCEETLFWKAFQRLPEERKEKISRLCFDKDKRLSLGACLLLMWGLEKRGVSSDEIRINYGKEGKPYLESVPEIYFNLSHSGEYAVCAVSDREIGCDVEKISECRLKLAKRFFSASEYDMLLQMETEAERKELFYRFWTLKESFIKVIGKGLYLPLQSFSILISEEEIRVSAAEEILKNNRYYFQEVSVSPEYKCALCGLEESIGTGVELEEVKLSELLTHVWSSGNVNSNI